MNDRISCGEHEALVEYVYGETGPDERAQFEAHLAGCADCRDALDGMRGVRAELADWALPDVAGVAREVNAALKETAAAAPQGRSETGGGTSARPWWASGALAAAAVLLLAVAAAIANLEITYGSDGFSIRTGWSGRTEPTEGASVAPQSVPSEAAGTAIATDTSSTAQPAASAAPWRDDLSALERRLRTEFQAASIGTRPATLSPEGARLLQRVQELIEQSEQRQRRELALRMAQVVRDFDTQRQTDLVRIQQGLGQLEGNTAADRQILNYLVRASQRQ